MSVTKYYSIPFVYAQQDNLVILCIANSSSFFGSNNSSLEDQYISEAQFVAVWKIDNQFTLKKQVVYDLSGKTKGFDTFRQITLRRITPGQFFGYNETEFGMTTKAKLTFSYIQVK